MRDASLAYYIKNRLGFGKVKKINGGGYLLKISNPKGIEKVIQFINGKIISENKYEEITKNILNPSHASLKKEIEFKLNLKNRFKLL